MYATKLFSTFIEYAYRFPASIAFTFTPAWYFESMVLAHALKTPLSSLSLALSDARQSADSPRKVKVALRQADCARLRLQSMLFSKSNNSDENFNVHEPLQSVVKWFESLGHQVQLLMKTSQEEVIELYGNQFLFEQMVEILINNGLHASLKDSLIVVSISKTKGSLQLVIQDFGEGMSTLELMMCEMSGYTNHADGWGIGLSCARRIISQFRGQLRINSWQHIGTQIICTLPLDHE